MKKIDRYVASTFLGPFVLCFVGFVGLYVVIDFFTNIDDFLARDSLAEMVRVTVQYYLFRIPSYLSQIMPVLTVVPAVICMIRLERGNETCAMRSSGISARRISVPVIACCAAVFVGAAINQEVVVPAMHGPMAAAERAAGKGSSRRIGFSYVVDRAGRFLLISSYDASEPMPTLTNVHMAWDDQFGGHHELEAKRAFAPARGATWYMEGVRQFDGRLTRFGASIWEDKEPQSFTSAATQALVKNYRSAPERATIPLMAAEKGTAPVAYDFGAYSETDELWPVAKDVEILYPAEPQKGRLRIDTMVWVGDRWLVFGAWRFGGIDPKTLTLDEERLPDGQVFESSIGPSDIQVGEFKRASAMMTLGELADAGSRFPSHRFRQRCWVVIWSRVTFPLANVILVLLTLPLVLRQRSHTALIGISLALLLTILYLVANLVSIDLAYRQFSIWKWPLFAGTFPTVVFAALAAWMFSRMDEV